MAYTDLRDFLDVLEERDEIVRISQPLDPELEICAVWTQLTLAQGPAALHEKGSVKNYSDWQVLTNLFGSYSKIAAAFEVEEENIFDHVYERMKERIPPRIVDQGPVNQNDYRGDDIDLTRQIPNIRWNEKDAGPFITAGHNVLEDPEYGINTAWYRIQILGPRQIAIRLAPQHHGGIYVRKARAAGAEEVDVAIYIGGDPVAICGTVASVPLEVDEYDIMGSIRGEPLELVRCETVDRQVPSHAEVLIEGKIQLNETVEEGPFGEFCGTYSDSYSEHPIKVTRLAHRDNPIFVGSAESKPINETHLLQAVFNSVNTKSNLQSLLPEVKDVYLPPDATGLFECIIQLDSDLTRPGIAKNLLYSANAGLISAKTFIVVDEDIDIYNRDEIQWALATRVQAQRDVIPVSDGITTPLDPSASHDGVTDKLLIDATMSDDFRGELIKVPEEHRKTAANVLKKAGWLGS